MNDLIPALTCRAGAWISPQHVLGTLALLEDRRAPRYRGGSDGFSYRLRFPGCPPLNLKSEDVLLGESLAVLVHRPNGNPVEWDERTDSIDDSGPGLVEERRSGCGAAQVIQQLVDVGLRLAGCPEEAEGQW